MGSTYKAAQNTYANVLGGRREDSRADMARRMREYADWLDSRRDFDNEARYAERFGPHFRGFNTDMKSIGRVVTFHAICKEVAASSVDLKAYLETGDLDPILAFAALEETPPMTLAEAEQKLRELEDMAEEERRNITEAESHLELFRDKTSLPLSGIEEILSRKSSEAELTRMIQESPARSVLGSRFSGITTRTDVLGFECDLAASLLPAMTRISR